MSTPRNKLPADFDALSALEAWVRAELALLAVEALEIEGVEARERALNDVLDRICTIQVRWRIDNRKP